MVCAHALLHLLARFSTPRSFFPAICIDFLAPVATFAGGKLEFSPIARSSVPRALPDLNALSIGRRAKREAIIGKRVFNFAACNVLITLFAGTNVENSP